MSMGKEVIRCGECQYFMKPEHICEKANGSGWGNDDDDGCTFGKRITNSIKQEDNDIDKMAEYIGGEDKKTNVEEPLIFENQTDHPFEVRTGIVFNSSGIYDVVVSGNRTVVYKVSSEKNSINEEDVKEKNKQMDSAYKRRNSSILGNCMGDK